MKFKVNFQETPRSFAVNFGESIVINPPAIDVPFYDGKYEAIPKFETQQLQTKGKQLTDDVRIQEIPVSVVSNIAGGNTVVIGG